MNRVIEHDFLCRMRPVNLENGIRWSLVDATIDCTVIMNRLQMYVDSVEDGPALGLAKETLGMAEGLKIECDTLLRQKTLESLNIPSISERLETLKEKLATVFQEISPSIVNQVDALL